MLHVLKAANYKVEIFVWVFKTKLVSNLDPVQVSDHRVKNFAYDSVFNKYAKRIHHYAHKCMSICDTGGPLELRDTSYFFFQFIIVKSLKFPYIFRERNEH